MEDRLLLPFISEPDHFHIIRTREDIRGLCGVIGDNSVDEDRHGVVTQADIPEGVLYHICEDCEAIDSGSDRGPTDADTAPDGAPGHRGSGDDRPEEAEGTRNTAVRNPASAVERKERSR